MSRRLQNASIRALDGSSVRILRALEAPRMARDASKQIIIVDDDEDLRYMASKKLRNAGWEVIEAKNGAEAVRLILEHPGCRRMITDFVMPTFGGNQWIRFLERFCEGWCIAVISSEDIDPGPFIYVPKPVDFMHLVQVFEEDAA